MGTGCSLTLFEDEERSTKKVKDRSVVEVEGGTSSFKDILLSQSRQVSIEEEVKEVLEIGDDDVKISLATDMPEMEFQIGFRA